MNMRYLLAPMAASQRSSSSSFPELRERGAFDMAFSTSDLRIRILRPTRRTSTVPLRANAQCLRLPSGDCFWSIQSSSLFCSSATSSEMSWATRLVFIRTSPTWREKHGPLRARVRLGDAYPITPVAVLIPLRSVRPAQFTSYLRRLLPGAGALGELSALLYPRQRSWPF